MRLSEFLQQKEKAITVVFFDKDHKKTETVTLSSRLGMREIERRAQGIMDKSGYGSYEVISDISGDQL